MTRVVVKNIYQKDTCHGELGLCVQVVDTTLGLVDAI
jgi:hypothetical protein